MKLLIDIDSTVNQRFSADLNGNTYDFALVYKALLKQWCISCWLNGNAVFEGVGLVAGIDVTSSLGLVGFGQLWLEGEEAAIDNLGTHNKLIWVSP